MIKALESNSEVEAFLQVQKKRGSSALSLGQVCVGESVMLTLPQAIKTLIQMA